jgi:NAD(P)-dependent dehydrogenase (short-subunit alcohol dehydrogenase family)
MTQLRTLVITGGSSGIGAATVKLAAQRGYQAVYSGSRPLSAVPEELRNLPAQYFQVDVRDPSQVSLFRDQTMRSFPQGLGRLLVVASAGISKRGNPEAIEEMRQTNVHGTLYLLDSFLENLRQNPESRFVGFGSIVAAEEKAVTGDEEYQRTKREIQELIARIPQDPALAGVQAFTLVPGAIDTPMTRKEMVFGLLMVGALGRLHAEGSFRAGLATFLGGDDKVGSTAVETLKNLLGEGLFGQPSFARLGKFLAKDPNLKDGRIGLLIAKALTEEDQILERVVGALAAMDVVITPEVVAERLLDQFESGQIPEKGLLKVYSREGEDPVVKLL